MLPLSNSCRRGCVEELESRQLLSLGPTPLEQELLEHLNRTRAEPQQELEHLFSALRPLTAREPVVQRAVNYFDVDAATLLRQWLKIESAPPLAWNSSLKLAALGHNRAMIDHDLQTHRVPGELGIAERVQYTGYPMRSASENVYAFARSVGHAHAAFAIDWGNGADGIQSPPAHRVNMLSDRYQEIGISIVSGEELPTSLGPLIVTENFGTRDNYQSQIVGVVYDDRNQNAKYDAGEGLPNVAIEIRSSDRVYQTQTWAAGGYQIPVAAGRYTVAASGGELQLRMSVSDIRVGHENVKVDFNRQDRLPGEVDQELDTRHVIALLQSGKSFTGHPANSRPGDWNQDGIFDRQDIMMLLSTATPALTSDSGPAVVWQQSDDAELRAGVQPGQHDGRPEAERMIAPSNTHELMVMMLQSGKFQLDEFATAAEGDANLDGRFDQRDLPLLFQGIQTVPLNTVSTPRPQIGTDRDETRLPGDVNNDGRFDRHDILLVMQAGGYPAPTASGFDAGDWNGDGRFDAVDLTFALQQTGWSERTVDTPPVTRPTSSADPNHDGRFDQLDIILAMQSDRLMSGQKATAAEGDWNGDGRSDQVDLILALQSWSLPDTNKIAGPLPQPGDANGDGQFDRLDIMSVLQGGKYRTGRSASFAEGDFNGDRLVDHWDFILALEFNQFA